MKLTPAYSMTFINFFLAASMLQAVRSTVLPAYLWPLAYIYNETVPVTPLMAVHGGVTQGKDQSLDFDGKTGWIDAGDFSGQCIAQPSLCKDGLSLGLRVKLSPFQNSDKAFIFDSGGHLGNGVSFYVKNKLMFFEVGSSKKLWQLNIPLETKRWHFILLTWSSVFGLKLFMDGPLVANTRESQSSVTTIDVGSHITIGKANHDFEVTVGQFSIEMVAIFNKFVPEGKVMLSYSYSPPNQPEGNIRYVNARFINQGHQFIHIFPDRGAKKNSGYLIAPKTSTLLEFVLREGPLPYGMDFMVKQNDTGSVIQMNGKDWIHVGASDDSQVLVEINIGDDVIYNLVYSTQGILPDYDLKNSSRTKKLSLNSTLVHGISASSFAPDKSASVESLEHKYLSATLADQSNTNKQENVPLVNEFTKEVFTLTPNTLTSPSSNIFLNSSETQLNSTFVNEKSRNFTQNQSKTFDDLTLHLDQHAENEAKINNEIKNETFSSLTSLDSNTTIFNNNWHVESTENLSIPFNSNITGCKTCKPDEITISTEQATNIENMLDGLKILSAIKGSINVSSSNVTNLFDDKIDCSEFSITDGLKKCKEINDLRSNFTTVNTTEIITTTVTSPTTTLTTTSATAPTTTKTITNVPTTTILTTSATPTTTTPTAATTITTSTTTTTSTTPTTTTSTTITTSSIPTTTVSTTLTQQEITYPPWQTTTPFPPPTKTTPFYNVWWTPPHQLPLYKDSHWTFKIVDTPKPPNAGCFKYGDLELCSSTPPPQTTKSSTTTIITTAPVTTKVFTPTTKFHRRTTKSLPVIIPQTEPKTRPPPLVTKYITNTSPAVKVTNTTTKKPTKSAVKFLSNNCICRPVTAFILPCCLQLVRAGAYLPVSGAANVKPGNQLPSGKPCFYPNCVEQVYGQAGTILLSPNVNGQYDVMQSPVVSFNNAEGLKLATAINYKQQQNLLSTYYKQQQKQRLISLQQQKYFASLPKPQLQYNEASLLKKQAKVLPQQQKAQSSFYQSGFFQNSNLPNYFQYNMPVPESTALTAPQNLYSSLNSKFQTQTFLKPELNQAYFYNQPITNNQNSLYNQKFLSNLQSFNGYPLNPVNTFGDIGSPQVVNWKNQYLKTRSKMVEQNDTPFKHEKLFDDVSTENKYTKLTPNKLWRNSMIITIGEVLPNVTAPQMEQDKFENETHLPIAGTAETFSGHLGKTILFTDIVGNTITSAPQLEVFGTVKKWQGGLKFDGKTSWINATKIDAPFLYDPSLSKEYGFAIGLKLMFDSSIKHYKHPKYILDAGGVDGRGLTLFIENGTLFSILTMSSQTWEASSNLTIDEWIYLSVAWKPVDGLFIYINGLKVGESLSPTLTNAIYTTSSNIILGANIKHDGESFLLMYLSSIDIMNVYVDNKQLIEYAAPVLKDSFVITFSTLNAGALTNHPRIKVVGTVTENRGVLVFDGMQTYLYDTGEFNDTFVMIPSLSPAGLTFVVKFKYDRSAMKESGEKFIIDSGGWLGHGVSLFVLGGELTAVVSSKGRVWVAQTTDVFTSWCLVLVTWREEMGIYMYLNGALVAKEKLSRFLISELKSLQEFTVGCSVNRGDTSYGKFQIAMVSLYPTYTSIDELMKISPPLVLHPTFDWFLLLIQNNRTLTSPSLRVFGDVKSTENGLTFDGESGWVETDLLEDFSEEKAEIICEHFQKDISCPSDQIIKVVYANYGRTSDIPCQGRRKYIITNCKSVGTLSKAKGMCDGKNECTMKALNMVWGNTCPGIVKYLDIRYQCIGKLHQNSSELQLGAHFITNPTLARSGLTIAVKIRLSKTSDYYTSPHFILDSGGYHGKGVSLYVMNKRIFCTLSTNSSTWEVNTSVESEDWLYVLVTWRKDQGVVLYINGIIRAVSTKPSVNNNSHMAAATTFILGKSVFNHPNSFTKFQVTTFTVLKTYTSRSESFRLFSYYIGRSIANSYEGFSSSLNPDTVIVCEYQSSTILCPSDQFIEILFANYGRTSQRPCSWGTHRETNCSLANSIDIARKECNGKNSCELVAKNSMWKVNPCPGIIKYVEVKYICDGAGPRGAVSSQYVGSEDPNSLVIP